MLRVAQELYYSYSTCQQSANVAGRREGGKEGRRETVSPHTFQQAFPQESSSQKPSPSQPSRLRKFPPTSFSPSQSPIASSASLTNLHQMPYLPAFLLSQILPFHNKFSFALVLLAISEIHPPQSKNGFRMCEYRPSVSVSYRLYRAPDLSTRHM